MKKFQSKPYRRWLCLGLLCAGLAQAQEVASPAVAASPVPVASELPQADTKPVPAGIMKKVQGTVLVRGLDAAAPRAVTSGDAWFAGERLVTKADSAASLTLRDGIELVLAANTAVALPKFEYDTTTQEGNILLDFLGGQLRILSGLIAKNKSENMRIKTATALVGVRGTDFILEAPLSNDY